MAVMDRVPPDSADNNTAPNNDLPTVVSVHFPGVLRDPRNPANAIAALGGDDAVRAHVSAVSSLTCSEYVNVPPLTLSLRPGDASSTSNIQSAEPRPTQRTFALRVYRPTETTKTTQVHLHGRVEHTVQFPGIADWAYIGRRTLEATTNAVAKRKLQSLADEFSDAPDRLPTTPRKRHRTTSWRPKSQAEMRTQRAVDIAEFVRMNVSAPPPRPKPTPSVNANRDNANSANTEQAEANRDEAGTRDVAKKSEDENGEKEGDAPKESGSEANIESVPEIKQPDETNVEDGTNGNTPAEPVNGKRRMAAIGEQLQVMEQVRPWRFSRTGVEQAQTDYFFQQQSYQRESLLHGAFQLGQDRRSDAARLVNKPWKVAACGGGVPSRAPSPSALRVRSHGRPLAQRRVQNRELLYAHLRRLFGERPVWLRRNVCQHVAPELHGSFVHVARRVGYSFYGPGPFIQAWIRYGYDPRALPAARPFQVVDLRLNNPVVVEAIKVQYAKVKAPLSPKLRPMAFEPDYTLAEVPTLRHLFLQLCDIQIPEVQRLVAEEEFPDNYSPKFGFFTDLGYARVIKAIRKGVYEMAVAMLGEARAKHIVEEYIRVRKRRRCKLKDLLGEEAKKNVKKARKKPDSDVALINPAAAKVDAQKKKSTAKSSADVPAVAQRQNTIAGTEGDGLAVDGAVGLLVPIAPVTESSMLEGDDPPVVVVAERLSDGEGDDEDEEEVKLMNFEDVECFEVVEDDDDDDNDEHMNDDDADESDDSNWMEEE